MCLKVQLRILMLFLLILPGCISLKSRKGTSEEKGISAWQREYRQQEEFIRDFDRYDTRLDASKARPYEIELYYD